MTPLELATCLHGRTYRQELTKEEESRAKAAGLVVVFGHSDDNMELRGAIDDEVGCAGGGTAYLTATGLLANQCDCADCPYFARVRKSAATITARWDEEGYTWVYQTAIPHATFDIQSDDPADGPYCRGIVFALADVARVLPEVNS